MGLNPRVWSLARYHLSYLGYLLKWIQEAQVFREFFLQKFEYLRKFQEKLRKIKEKFDFHSRWGPGRDGIAGIGAQTEHPTPIYGSSHMINGHFPKILKLKYLDYSLKMIIVLHCFFIDALSPHIFKNVHDFFFIISSNLSKHSNPKKDINFAHFSLSGVHFRRRFS